MTLATAVLALAVVSPHGGGTADLRLSLQDGPDPIAPTVTLRYTIVVQNGGPNDAADVFATVNLPPGVVLTQASSNCVVDTPSSLTCYRMFLAANAEETIGTIDTYAPVGLTGPLTASASVTQAGTDPDPTSNVADTTTQTRPGLRIVAPPVVEGNVGIRDAGIAIELLSDGSALPLAVTVDWQTAPGTASTGSDFVPASGALTFSASATSHHIPVGVVGDTVPEISEVFFILLTNAQGALPIPNTEGPLIANDDASLGATAELSHGVARTTPMPASAPAEDRYRVVVPPRSSVEVVVEALSGDLLPFAVERLSGNGTVVQSGDLTGTGAGVTLRWINGGATPVADDLVRVRSGGCSTDCGPDDIYRIRAYDTTARVPRFNNTVSQVTVLMLQNPTDRGVFGAVSLWDVTGALITEMLLAVPARGTTVLNTGTVAAGRSGSITIRHDAPYGLLQGKAVSVEPATGLSFDTPLTYRPR